MLNNKIKNSIQEFDAEYSGYYEDNIQRQKRLKILIEKYDVTTIALAAGMTESTLIQYVRAKTAPAINENSVLKAERWVEFYENK
jgi:rhamnose utilization protein RhaD (predicted bifunctional aldolase and dehydrogenase)